VGCYKQLEAIRGAFLISRASRPVEDLIVRSGLRDVFLGAARRATGAVTETRAAVSASKRGEQIERPEGTFEVFTLSESSRMKPTLIGNPALLPGCRFQKEHCSRQAFKWSAFAVGVGTLGDSFEDYEGRFGRWHRARRFPDTSMPPLSTTPIFKKARLICRTRFAPFCERLAAGSAPPAERRPAHGRRGRKRVRSRRDLDGTRFVTASPGSILETSSWSLDDRIDSFTPRAGSVHQLPDF
jgi:hypothetical protein